MYEGAETGNLMAKAHWVAEAFVIRCYPEDEPAFVATWEAFEEWVKRYKIQETEKLASEVLLAYAQVGLGFAAQEGLDEKSKILIGTVVKTMCDTQGKMLSLMDFKLIVGETAAGTGASGEFLATLLRHLPNLFVEAQVANLEVAEAHVSVPQKPLYEIWTEGEHNVIEVDTIVDYLQTKKKKKKNYLLWLDRDEKKHKSIRSPGQTLGSEAVDLIIYLVERLGRRVPCVDVLRDVFKDEPMSNMLDEHERNKIEQQLTALNKFCGRKLRRHLFSDKFGRGLGLRRSFSDKYFIFARLR